jgi:hypothetical protein
MYNARCDRFNKLFEVQDIFLQLHALLAKASDVHQRSLFKNKEFETCSVDLEQP